jgi:hypothetical protein
MRTEQGQQRPAAMLSCKIIRFLGTAKSFAYIPDPFFGLELGFTHFSLSVLSAQTSHGLEQKLSQLAELIEQYVEFVDKNGRSVHLPAKFVRHYLKR